MEALPAQLALVPLSGSSPWPRSETVDLLNSLPHNSDVMAATLRVETL